MSEAHWNLVLVVAKCAGAIFALLAGGLWWRACTVKELIPSKDLRVVPQGERYCAFLDGKTVAIDEMGRRFDPVMTLMQQERWNSLAAAFTAAAAFAQAAVLIIDGLHAAGIIPIH